MAKRHRGRVAIAAVVAIGLALTGCSGLLGSSQEAGDGKVGGTVVQFNSADEWANYKAVRAAFREASGINVPADIKNSGQALTAIQEQKANPQADVGYWGITFGINAAAEGLLEPYKPAGFDDVADDLKAADGSWVGVHYGVVAMLVNTDALGDTPIPKSWDDLTKEEYRDKVFYADPASAAVGFYTAVAINLSQGGTEDDFDPGIAFLKKMQANGAKAPTNTSPAKAASGEYPILIDTDFNGYNQKYNQGANIEVVIPSDGTVKVPYTVGMVKNGPNAEGAKKWIDFLLSDDGQQLFAQFFVHPVRGELPAEIQAKMAPASAYDAAIDFDAMKLTKAQKGFTERFISEVSAG